MTMKPAGQLGVGDMLRVNLGRGTSGRMVDRVEDAPDDCVKVFLYCESGPRTQFTLPKSRMVEVED
jgi:hypothetical protein